MFIEKKILDTFGDALTCFIKSTHLDFTKGRTELFRVTYCTYVCMYTKNRMNCHYGSRASKSFRYIASFSNVVPFFATAKEMMRDRIYSDVMKA
jgi:hypothetical protein